MRHRIKDYTITGDTDITIKGNVSVEDVRLIVDETQGEVICSSMKKSNVTCVYVEDLDQTHISFDKSICEMQPNDLLTIEIDKGEETAKEQTITDGVNTLAGMIDQAFDAQAQIYQLIAIQLQTIIGE
jgi:hypothetical protein